MQSYEDRLMRVLRYIHDHPADDLSLDRLADVAALSRFHWHRVFHAMTGETCAQAVRRVRLHRAATMLLNGTDTPEAIAVRVGYDNPRSFARAFAQTYGASPAAFRRQGRHEAPLLLRKNGEGEMFPVDIRSDPVRRVIGLPHQGAYMQVGRSFDSFSALAGQRGLWPRLGPMMGIYYDDPSAVPEAALRSFAGAEWLGPDAAEGMEERQVAGGRVAVLTFRGPYAGLHRAYDWLFGTWLAGSGELPGEAPCYERYLNAPNATAPEDLLTEICLPLKEAGHG